MSNQTYPKNQSYLFNNLEIIDTFISYQKGRPLMYKYFDYEKFHKLDQTEKKFLHSLSAMIHVNKK